MPSIADLLRREIERSPQTITDIARATGVPQPRLWNFMHGDQASLKLESAEKLIKYFGFTIVRAGELAELRRQAPQGSGNKHRGPGTRHRRKQS